MTRSRTPQFLRFVVVGTIGFVVDAGITGLTTAAGASPFVARVPALAAAIVTTWLLNRSHTFRVERDPTVGELARYATVALTSAAMNYAIYGALVVAGCPPVAAVAVATLLLVVFSFFAYRQVAFR